MNQYLCNTFDISCYVSYSTETTAENTDNRKSTLLNPRINTILI